MQRSNGTITRLVTIIICTVLVVQLTGCGYLLHPERRGQKVNLGTAKRVHIAFNTYLQDLGLMLLGVIPGVIALAVDYSTGCIYLSPKEIARDKRSSLEDMNNTDHWKIVKVDPNTLNKATIEKIVQEQTGKTIQLDSPDMLLFKPEHTNMNIIEELSNLQMGKSPTIKGILFRGSQAVFIEDATGRTVKIEITVPMNTCMLSE